MRDPQNNCLKTYVLVARMNALIQQIFVGWQAYFTENVFHK